MRTRGAWYCIVCVREMPKLGKGDIRGQKKRWKQRRRARAGGLRDQVQWVFDVNADRCRSCNAPVERGQLFCDTVTCNPEKYRKRRRFRRK